MKYKCVLLLILTNSLYLSAQNFIEYESFGFNTHEIRSMDSQGNTIVALKIFMTGNPMFSTVKIWIPVFSSSSAVEITTDAVRRAILGPARWIYTEYSRNENGLARYFLGDLLAGVGVPNRQYWNRLENGGFQGPLDSYLRYITDRSGQLITIERSGPHGLIGTVENYGEPLGLIPFPIGPSFQEGRNTSQSVMYNDDGSIIIEFGNSESIRFFNIPENELIDLYLTAFTQTVRHSLEPISKIDRNNLESKTKEELAIIRNVLFAWNGFGFQSQYWTNFMSRHLPIVTRMRSGVYWDNDSSQNIIDRFTEEERSLLDFILELERR